MASGVTSRARSFKTPSKIVCDMTIKNLLIFSALLLVTACSTAQNESDRASLQIDCRAVGERQNRNEGWIQKCSTSRYILNDALKGEIICKDFGTVFRRDDKWVSECILSAAAAHEQAIEVQLMRMKPDTLCKLIWVGYGGMSAKLTQPIAEKRKLNCNQKISIWAEKAVTQMPIDKLCSVWLSKAGHPAYYKEVENEVLHKGYRCKTP